MTGELPSARRLTAATVVLRTLGHLPPGVTEGLWRHADVCHLSRQGTCRQIRWLLRDHLLAGLAAAEDWQPSWDAEAALLTVLSLRRLPTLLSVVGDFPSPA